MQIRVLRALKSSKVLIGVGGRRQSVKGVQERENTGNHGNKRDSTGKNGKKRDLPTLQAPNVESKPKQKEQKKHNPNKSNASLRL
ncbi:MAG: hypothetical protein ABSG33_08255 [Candidatus Bathyarchaeia archaeon]|jgi:hypothetical protein